MPALRPDMEVKWSAVLWLLLATVLQESAEAQLLLCTVASDTVHIMENNEIDQVVTTINTSEGVNLTLDSNPHEAFGLLGNDLVAVKRLDYETLPGALTVRIKCSHPESNPETLLVFVVVENENDNDPVFNQSHYVLAVDELTALGTRVARIEATDPDGDLLFYRIEPDLDSYFKVQSVNNPNILVQKTIDYDVVRQDVFTLFVQDDTDASGKARNGSATVTVNIVDVDNRPPWFQPCTETAVGSAKICFGPGYSGSVNLTEQATGPLVLHPGPLYAVDGDKGRNDEISYRILSGNEDGIFHISPNSGNVTMVKAADVLGPVVLTVLASQVLNADQFTTTTVTIGVVEKSLHPPVFVEAEYKGVVSSDSPPGSLVMEDKNLNKPVRVHAKDEDFADGVNPHVMYEIRDGDFAVTAEGFILVKNELAPGTKTLKVYAVDLSNGETGTTELSVQVLPGTTTVEPTTGIATVTPTTQLSTTNFPTSAPTSPTEESTPMPTSPTEQYTTLWPSSTKLITTPPTPVTSTDGALRSAGEFRTEDMAALGGTLGVLLVVCVVVIVLLIVRVQRGKADWKKLKEASVFRSSFSRGSSSPKDGMQYTNEGFQNDGDSGSVASQQQEETDLRLGHALVAKETSFLERSVPVISTAHYDTPLPDSGSQGGSERGDGEKEVKPILTKERKVEEGYKSVWFKEDIDPNAKEEVVIIPDSGEQDGEDDDSSDGEETSNGDTASASFANTQKAGETSRRDSSDSDDEDEVMTIQL